MLQRFFIIALLATASHTWPLTVYGQTDCENLPGEASIVYTLNSIDSPALRDASVFVSGALLPLTIGTPVLMYAYGMLSVTAFGATQQDLRYTSETGLQMGVTVITAYGITALLKQIVGRERPYQEYPDCIIGYGSSTDPSWPSGHSTGSAALATTLCLRYPQWYVVTPAVLYALYTGFARMNLGMHYLTDVLSGYAIGVGVALAVNALNNELFDLADPILPDKGIDTSTGMIIGTPTINVFSLNISF